MKRRMNETQTTNQQAESQPDPDSKPPDLADQRCVALPQRHSVMPASVRASQLSTNKALILAFIDKAEMHCRTTAELGLTGFVARVGCGDLPGSAQVVSE